MNRRLPIFKWKGSGVGETEEQPAMVSWRNCSSIGLEWGLWYICDSFSTSDCTVASKREIISEEWIGKYRTATGHGVIQVFSRHGGTEDWNVDWVRGNYEECKCNRWGALGFRTGYLSNEIPASYSYIRLLRTPGSVDHIIGYSD
jgi:hypothetical protein